MLFSFSRYFSLNGNNSAQYCAIKVKFKPVVAHSNAKILTNPDLSFASIAQILRNYVQLLHILQNTCAIAAILKNPEPLPSPGGPTWVLFQLFYS